MTVILSLFWNGFNDLIFSHECTTDPAFQEAGAGNVIVSLLHLYLMVFRGNSYHWKNKLVDHILEFYFKLLILFKAFAYFTCFPKYIRKLKSEGQFLQI
jgi:hypothetical protein